MWALIRLLLQEKSDQGSHCLIQRRFKKASRRHTADDIYHSAHIPACTKVLGNLGGDSGDALCVRVCARARVCVCVVTSQCWQHLFGRKAYNYHFVSSADRYFQG